MSNSEETPLTEYKAQCGANKYYYRDKSIDFVITSDPACRPRLILTNSIQLTAKFNMDIDDFFQMDGKTKFIDRMAAVLRINDRSRIKIVGMFRGSVLIEAYVESSFEYSEDEANSTDEEAELAELY